jgi:hypothetical protein
MGRAGFYEGSGGQVSSGCVTTTALVSGDLSHSDSVFNNLHDPVEFRSWEPFIGVCLTPFSWFIVHRPSLPREHSPLAPFTVLSLTK